MVTHVFSSLRSASFAAVFDTGRLYRELALGRNRAQTPWAADHPKTAIRQKTGFRPSLLLRDSTRNFRKGSRIRVRRKPGKSADDIAPAIARKA